jgi:SAM-dependent methyltransferase
LSSLIAKAKRLAIVAAGWIVGRRCPACGMKSILIQGRALWPALVAEWGLSPEWVRYLDEREGRRCGFCQSTLRDRQLAQGILQASSDMAGVQAGSLKTLCKQTPFRALTIAEINAAGCLHRFFTCLPNLYYSEFGSTSADVPAQDLMALSYTDAMFDLVITSETLEHVPDLHRALAEIRRVLKPGGMHVFTVPVVGDGRKTRRRASLANGEVIYHLPPSYHGAPGKAASDFLVFYEFGSDFFQECAASGFDIQLLKDETNPALTVFLARKPASH